MWRWIRTMWPFSRSGAGPESSAAVEAASLSLERAVEDRRRATAQRIEADRWAERVRGHNAANRYDDWLRDVIQGRNA